MSKHDDTVSMRHMLEHALEACEIVNKRKRSDLKTNRLLELALTRLIEIIGEVATRVSESAREQHGDIPWKNIMGIRNRLIHGYDMVDLDLLWDTVEINLPPLINQLRKIVVEQR